MSEKAVITGEGLALVRKGDVEFHISAHPNTISISDGHHTMDELYDHRNLLFCAFLSQLNVSEQGYVWRSKLHEDGTMYPGWFIAGAAQGGFRKTVIYSKLLQLGEEHNDIYINPNSELSYHLPLEFWPLLDFAWTLEKGIPYSGYTSKDVLERLRNYYL